MAVGRIWNGTIRTGQRITVVREEADDTAGAVEPGRTVTLSGTVTSLQTAHGIDRVDIEEAGPGDIVSVAGLPEVTIGDTLTDPADPRPLPRLDVDAPTLRMTFGVNTSPLAGREGKYVTSRQIKARLEKEVLGNVSIEVRPSESSEAFEVRGRGELQLAVLIEQMRREGFELTASRPEVLLREVRGELQEPYERITIDIPPDYIGEIQTALAGRKGRLEQLSTDTDGRVRMEYVLPVRGLIGYRGHVDDLGAEDRPQPRLEGHCGSLRREAEDVDERGRPVADHLQLVEEGGGALVAGLVGAVLGKGELVQPAGEREVLEHAALHALVHVGIDQTGDDRTAFAIDHPCSVGREPGADGRDAPSRYRDVSLDDRLGRDDEAAADDEIRCGHRPSGGSRSPPPGRRGCAGTRWSYGRPGCAARRSCRSGSRG